MKDGIMKNSAQQKRRSFRKMYKDTSDYNTKKNDKHGCVFLVFCIKGLVQCARYSTRVHWTSNFLQDTTAMFKRSPCKKCIIEDTGLRGCWDRTGRGPAGGSSPASTRSGFYKVPDLRGMGSEFKFCVISFF